MTTGRAVSLYGIGAQLREERLRRNRALDDIATETRISSRYLLAIEAEDYAQLPGLVFTRNFVKQYALALQMNPDPLVARLPKLDESMVKLPAAPTREPSRQWQAGSNPALTSAVWLVVLAGAGVAAYYHFNGFPWVRMHLPAMVKTAQAAAKAARQDAEARPVPPPPPASTPEPATQPAEGEQIAQSIDPATVPQQAPVALTPAANVAGAPESASSNRPVQVVVTAREVVWVQVTADGKTAYTGTLRPNETKAISADGQVRVLTGNAGGLTISLNGRTLDPLGPEGQVRSVRLTAEGPEFPAAKAATPLADPL